MKEETFTLYFIKLCFCTKKEFWQMFLGSNCLVFYDEVKLQMWKFKKLCKELWITHEKFLLNTLIWIITRSHDSRTLRELIIHYMWCPLIDSVTANQLDFFTHSYPTNRNPSSAVVWNPWLCLLPVVLDR